MVVSRAEGAPWPGQRTPVLLGDLEATGWAAVMAAKALAADWRSLRARYSPKVRVGTAELMRGKRGRSSSIFGEHVRLWLLTDIPTSGE